MKLIPREPQIQSAHAILTLGESYILQLRDNKPTVAAAGQWALFGGRLQKCETPLQAVKREVFEELSIEPLDFVPLWFEDFYASFEKGIIRVWFFEADVSAIWYHHKLKEGKAVRLFRFEEISDLKMHPVIRRAIEHHFKKSCKKDR